MYKETQGKYKQSKDIQNKDIKNRKTQSREVQLECTGITIAYDRVNVFENVSMNVCAGDYVSIVDRKSVV